MRYLAFAAPSFPFPRYPRSRISASRPSATCSIRPSASSASSIVDMEIDADKKRAASDEDAYPRGKDGDFRRIYVGDSPLIDVGTCIEIQRDERAHLRAARVRPASKVVLLNSRGDSAVGELSADNTTVTISMTRKKKKKEECGSMNVGVALCEPKVVSRCDWTIEKLAELGVSNAIVVCGGMERMNAMRTNKSKRLERWKRIAVAAAKQSLADSVMQIEGNQCGLLDVVRNNSNYGKVLLASPVGRPIAQVLQDANAGDRKVDDVLILIGPEGGTTNEEEEALFKLGVIPVSLGGSRLRVETAALVAASIVRCYRF